jgi:peptidyl-prolyl cis-trans isomerase SurA
MSFLRKIITASVCITGLTTAHAQTLFTYGAKSVSKEEFLKAYNKNNTETAPTDQSYRDYLDLYTRFKIKVQAALDAKLDTLPNQQQELAAFRGQVVESYMNDEASVNVLMDEAMERSNKDLHRPYLHCCRLHSHSRTGTTGPTKD